MNALLSRIRNLIFVSNGANLCQRVQQRQNQSEALSELRGSDDVIKVVTSKLRPVKFQIPPGHIKAKMSLLCVMPIKNPSKPTPRADELTEIRRNLNELLNIDGLLFWGASVNGRAMKRTEFVEWLKLEPEKTKTLVPSTLQNALINAVSNFERNGVQFVSHLDAVQRHFIKILTHMQTTTTKTNDSTNKV